MRKKNTLSQVRDVVSSLGRCDLRVSRKYPKDKEMKDFYTIECLDSENKVKWDATFSLDNGFLYITTDNRAIMYSEIDMISSLDKVLERMRKND